MRPEQWQRFKSAAKRQPVEAPPLALIIDSPWIPGYLGISHMDYYLNPELWFQANRSIMEAFPEVIFFPSWWIEYGMAIEPSALGAKICFHDDQTPSVSPTLFRITDADHLAAVQPLHDGFMSLTLHRYRMQKQRIFDAGYTLPVVTARGPLCTAAFFRGLNDFMMEIYENPAAVHTLLKKTTRLTIDWLKAQADTIGAGVEGIFILDDIVGFLSRTHYEEFAHPYLCQICEAFPADWVKVYHNDANISPFMEELPRTGFDVINWGKQIDIEDAVQRIQGRMCLMGNVNPLEIAVRGTAAEVEQATREVISKAAGHPLIVSVGGGTSPGMPAANIQAMIRACGASK